MRSGPPGSNASPNPGRPSYNPTAAQSAGDASDGGDGGHGGHGGQGPVGLKAPHLTIVALEIDAMPDIILPGQQGGRGGRGGRGANGGNGQRGRSSATRLGICRRSVGYGGAGGNGGNGGLGGRGGHGGDGAKVTIATQAEQLQALVTEKPFTLDNSGGSGGDPGVQGQPGDGGRGGTAGERNSRMCRGHTERRGHPGQRGRSLGDRARGNAGSPGDIEFTNITEDDWNKKLEKPWITAIEPSNGFAEDRVTVKGLHFVSNSRVLFDGSPVATSFNFDRQMAFTVPLNARGGEHSVQVETPGSEASNEVPFTVKPRLDEAQIGGSPTTQVAQGDELTLVGRSFDPDATVLLNDEPIEIKSVSVAEIKLRILEEIGEDPGGDDRLVIQNPDGNQSNELILKRLPSLDSGFRPSVHGYPFHNFKVGDATWGAFRQTFGTAHIARQAIQRPIRTGAFYNFYRWFLRSNGLCSGMSATSLQTFHQSMDEIFKDYIPTIDISKSDRPDPPDIPEDLWREITIVQGRVLSRELVTHYAAQGREGIIRVEKTLRDIEADFKSGMGESGARVLCYIPSGSVWDIFADEAAREAFMESHCVTPTRIVYGDENHSLDGARLFVYENNRPGEETCFIEFFMKDGDLHFKAPYSEGGAITYSSANSFTLGTATLQEQLLDSVSLPISSGFALDLILSPARILVEDDDGRTLGYKEGKMHSDPELGIVCPWLENYILVRETENKSLRRTVLGHGNGTYTYTTLQPDGRSLTIQDAACSASTHDEVQVSNNLDDVEIKVSETKSIELHFGEDEDDAEDIVRHVCVRCELQQDERTMIHLNEGMDGIEIVTPERDLAVDLEVRRIRGDTVLSERTLRTTVPHDKSVGLRHGLWQDLDRVQPEIR